MRNANEFKRSAEMIIYGMTSIYPRRSGGKPGLNETGDFSPAERNRIFRPDILDTDADPGKRREREEEVEENEMDDRWP